LASDSEANCPNRDQHDHTQSRAYTATRLPGAAYAATLFPGATHSATPVTSHSRRLIRNS
jgi:hypothetical protein